MKCTLAELRYKEVIDIVDGSRYGFVGDVELDMESGTVKAIAHPRPPAVVWTVGPGGGHSLSLVICETIWRGYYFGGGWRTKR